MKTIICFFCCAFLMSVYSAPAQTIALYLFDEQVGMYPSCVLNDASENDYPLVLGPGGRIVPGRYGNGLDAMEQPAVEYPDGPADFGLKALPVPGGRTQEPMTWMNANFCALMTSGENHLRREVGFVHPTQTRLNLGDFDWTVEFWFKPHGRSEAHGVIFETGRGPRGENGEITTLILNAGADAFTFINQPAGVRLIIPSDGKALNPHANAWHHLTFVYSAALRQLYHYVDGKLQRLPDRCELRPLSYGEEDYLSIGRDGTWAHPLQGSIDELRFSQGMVYHRKFTPPKSFSAVNTESRRNDALVKGPPLLFDAGSDVPIRLGARKHLFIDDALIAESRNIRFVVNPPRFAGRVIDRIRGQFRKHLTVVEDDSGVIRLYNSIVDDYLAVRVSRDGMHWEQPDMGSEYRGRRNIVIHEPVGGLGNPFIDPNGPPEQRWKYITGYHDRGIYLYTSADGYRWQRQKTAVLPFKSGTQSCTFYDDQRQLYVGYHRTGFARTPGGATQRESVRTEVADLFTSWPFRPVTQAETWEAAKTRRLRDPQPWYLDNGPLTPGGFGIEYPAAFQPVDSLDPAGTDIYVSKAVKYPYAPDTYLAFPIVYFHYQADGPVTRQVLIMPERGRGSGPVETQLAVSRDGVNWTRYPRPAYVGIGRQDGRDIHQAYIAHGMVKRGKEIWQYCYGETDYHSPWTKGDSLRGVYRLVQRMDGFVSIDAPCDADGLLITKPLVFDGNRLVLNIDTDAAGYCQVGFIGADGRPIGGFALDDCIYINGDFIDTEVEWMNSGADLTSLAGQTVQVVFRMRGCKLYSMQFIAK